MLRTSGALVLASFTLSAAPRLYLVHIASLSAGGVDPPYSVITAFKSASGVLYAELDVRVQVRTCNKPTPASCPDMSNSWRCFPLSLSSQASGPPCCARVGSASSQAGVSDTAAPAASVPRKPRRLNMLMPPCWGFSLQNPNREALKIRRAHV